MTHTLVIRGFSDKVHEKLGNLATQKGVSINSIVRDAVDKWLEQHQSETIRKHHLIIYSDDESLIKLLKSMDKFAKDSNLYRCFCGPSDIQAAKLLDRLGWRNCTLDPYFYLNNHHNHPHHQHIKQRNGISQTQNEKDIYDYCSKVMENIANKADNEPVCCMDFLINDIGKNSLTEALAIEKAYDNDRIGGFMYCTYKTDVLLESGTQDLIDLFETHDQVFILKKDEVYKLHVTRENVHKLFLN
ncbi:hypothetical protein [Candidatus Nitrosocosmicus franklandus]|uniref:Uncharacterized protein n=1 Tax=Candidatus Nitrosocosmicus franklandianus TaxID=1798806 RepID=A0A484IAU1_9ARCH|nr:hypothetical protein [Candidatus Nitrosocosmicus franklandus]VFJ14872.1 conserved protein of unknown function [Candidatus Nitrosocosmicus franklandus]